LYANLLANPVNHSSPDTLKNAVFNFDIAPPLPIKLPIVVSSSPFTAKGFCNATCISFVTAWFKFLATPFSDLAVPPVWANALNHVDQLVELVKGCIKSPNDAIVTLSNIFKLDIVDNTPEVFFNWFLLACPNLSKYASIVSSTNLISFLANSLQLDLPVFLYFVFIPCIYGTKNSPLGPNLWANAIDFEDLFTNEANICAGSLTKKLPSVNNFSTCLYGPVNTLCFVMWLLNGVNI